MSREATPLALALTHPARLRAHACVHGVGPATLEGRFRYLELGCGGGHNLLPLAAHFPAASFVGVEPDDGRRSTAESARQACGLDQVELLATLEGNEGQREPFDYVIAHGIYSWVDQEAQCDLLASCRRWLANDGVACVSYNTLPGWSLRGVLRHLMLGAVADDSSEGRVVAARSVAGQLRRELKRQDHPYHAMLAAELDAVTERADEELLEDHLAHHNEPLYFQDFVARGAEHGLRYVTELVAASADGAMDIDVPRRLMGDGMVRTTAEQWLDVLCFRQLRASLLCRDSVAVEAEPNEMRLLPEGHFAGRLAIVAEEPLLGPGKVLQLRTSSGVVIEADQPMLKAALLVLAQAWPRGFRAQPLISEALAELRMRGLATDEITDEGEVERTVHDLVALSERRQIELLGWAPTWVDEVAAAPFVHPLTRWEADRSAWVTSPRHQPVELDPLTRSVVRLLDGTRDLQALAHAIGQRIDGGALTLDVEIPAERRADMHAGLAMQAVMTARNLGLLAQQEQRRPRAK